MHSKELRVIVGEINPPTLICYFIIKLPSLGRYLSVKYSDILGEFSNL